MKTTGNVEQNFLQNNKENEVKTGTTLLAVQFDGGVILGADSRTSAGIYAVNRFTDKLTYVSDYIYCGRSGSAADTQAVSDIVASHMEILQIKLGEPPLVEVAANTFREICYEYRDQLSASILVAGWDRVKGGQIYQIPLGGMMIQCPVGAAGSGSTFITGYIDANYRPNMTKDEAIEFIKKGVTLALTRDNSSSGVVRLAIITESGVERRTFLHNELPEFFTG